jgi:outer membrane protein TolC
MRQRRRIGGVLALLAAVVLPASGLAQAPRVLSAEDVLASSAVHFPTILEALAERRGADAALLEAEGAFDLVFGVDGSSRTAGFYDGSVIDSGVRQNFGPLGSSAYAGYRLSDGTFPIYEDANYTNDRGELKVGVLFSLLRDRDIDDRRFRRTDARLAIREASLDLLLTRVGVQQRALAAYWRWVTAGRQLEVYDTLLAIALERESGLEEQVRSGALAEIFLVENGQNITRRQRLAASARRDFQSAGLALSFYYRDANGEPQLPVADQLPPAAPIGELESLAVGAGPGMITSIMQRPELAILRTAIERAQNRIALAENSLKPRVDLNFELSHGLGSIAEGGLSRDSTDAAMRLSFSVPLQRRAARGRIARERAEVEVLEQRERLQLDRLEVEVQDIVLSLDVAEDLLRLAEQEVDQAETMRDAEQQRFESGASDFFLVNIREERAADARIQYLAADLERRIARINFDATTMDLERLGVDETATP